MITRMLKGWFIWILIKENVNWMKNNRECRVLHENEIDDYLDDVIIGILARNISARKTKS